MEDVKRHFETFEKMKTHLTEQDVLKIALPMLKKEYPEKVLKIMNPIMQNLKMVIGMFLERFQKIGVVVPQKAVVQDKDGTILKITHTQ